MELNRIYILVKRDPVSRSFLSPNAKNVLEVFSLVRNIYYFPVIDKLYINIRVSEFDMLLGRDH